MVTGVNKSQRKSTGATGQSYLLSRMCHVMRGEREREGKRKRRGEEGEMNTMVGERGRGEESGEKMRHLRISSDGRSFANQQTSQVGQNWRRDEEIEGKGERKYLRINSEDVICSLANHANHQLTSQEGPWLR